VKNSKRHAIATYRDNDMKRRYCHICTAEENELTTNCCGYKIDQSLKNLIAENRIDFDMKWEIKG